ncbi:hypothetical protein O3G_MSEX004046 [Manduca sexta]|uniref:CHHC U11-48K-type domain-containing protein n=1 Tax=Manduca sexta TaxID=7130 RepID=A0A921YW51_MANSE|nr:hypothetical protein O3G_MSEX004046 [Manduca sexta]
MNDPYVSCPYDAVHRVPRSRLQQHLVKCQWRNPELLPCPYNATHRFTKEELIVHVKDCPSKPAVAPEDRPQKTVASLTTPYLYMHKTYKTNDDEDWDN